MRKVLDEMFKSGPRSFKVEALEILVLGVALQMIPLLGGNWRGGYQSMLLMTVAFAVSVAVRYVWWHFRPYQPAPVQPVTRYTNPRYIKPDDQ